MSDKPRNSPELAAFLKEIEAYKDKEIRVPEPDDDEAEPCKAVAVAWFWGEVVRLRGDAQATAGRVVLIEAGPLGVRYEVSWPDDRTTSFHYEFELEGDEE